ncbi:MAG: IS91 family transposase [Candidatus Bathyarchaeota archaeon]|nr:IS91 family transposase [Candidatus Bathyarchaeota archaeon]
MLELQDIVQTYGEEFRKAHNLIHQQEKALASISNCRTEKLGGNVKVCSDCGCYEISYNSCRNRHCNKCQSIKRHQWIDERLKDLLPVPYFHVVFTIPQELHSLFLGNLKTLLNELFTQSAATVLQLAESKKFLGGQVGIISTLHTWGQNLSFHPHIHMMIPGVGLSKTGLNCNRASRKFFLPVKLMARIFRAKLLIRLKQLYMEGHIHFDEDKTNFQALIECLFQKTWVVYAKKPFASTHYLLRYLSNYTHKVAISNSRLISMQNGNVSFRYKDYRDGKQKEMTLSVMEFLRRFCMHVLPKGFVRIRHYGVLSNTHRNKKLLLLKSLLGCLQPLQPKKSVLQLVDELIGRNPLQCRHCGGNLLTLRKTHAEEQNTG